MESGMVLGGPGFHAGAYTAPPIFGSIGITKECKIFEALLVLGRNRVKQTMQFGN